MPNIRSFRELRVYQAAFAAATRIFNITRTFPLEEKYSMVDQIRRSSRSICTNLAEAWRKRRYPAHFVSKLTDCEGEADETRVWLEFALASGYVNQALFAELDKAYDAILGQLVTMRLQPNKWIVGSSPRPPVSMSRRR